MLAGCVLYCKDLTHVLAGGPIAHELSHVRFIRAVYSVENRGAYATDLLTPEKPDISRCSI